MPTNSPETVLLPLDLGSVDDYDLSTLSLARYTRKGSIHTGHLFLRATLREMLKIYKLSGDTQSNRELLRETKSQYDDLMDRKAKLEELAAEKSINPIKVFAVHRRKRLFVNAGRELYIATRTTSEKMQCHFLSVALADVPPAEGETIAKNERISGFSVEPDGAHSDESNSFLNDATGMLRNLFANPSPSGNEHGDLGQSLTTEGTAEPVETLSPARSSVSSPTSPRPAGINITNLHYHNYNNTAPNPNSTSPGFTVNIHSSDHDGSVHNHVSPPNPLP
ncbi:hypothetical protein BDN67DRAFT_1014673 [Paxillus ammoniavirescens]|nr:hypothetical protein BDN67DRAFT_1014673 [Paxillus ammoniavirescens]